MTTVNGIIVIDTGDGTIAIKKADIQSVHSVVYFYPVYHSTLFVALAGHHDPVGIPFSCNGAEKAEKLLVSEWIEDDA